MSLTITDLKSPVGDVDGAVWFPELASDAVDALLGGYLTDAAGRTSDEQAQRKWSYYRAATAVADRLGGKAASKTLAAPDVGSKTLTTSADQWKYWDQKAQRYLAEYEALVGAVVDVVTSIPRPSQSVLIASW